MIPLAAEAWEAVLFAGLIPIAGAVAVAYLLYRAARNGGTGEGERGEDHEGPE